MNERQIPSVGHILVTGSGGFIGKHLVARLHMLGAQVFEIKNRQDCNLCDFEATGQRIQAIAPDVIVHLAATPDNGQALSPSTRPETQSNTLSCVTNLIHALPQDHPCLFIHVGSYKQYGNTSLPFREDTEVCPHSVYSFAKNKAEEFVQQSRSAFLHDISLRVGPAFGPGQGLERLIPRTIQNILTGQIERITLANTIWDPVYIDDVIDAICLCMVQTNARGRTINISGGICYTPREIVALIAQLLETSLSPSLLEEKSTLFQLPSWGDITLARNILGWSPKTPFFSGLHSTISYVQSLLSLPEPGHH